ncbi:ATP-binding protein [Streptomyces inusitatus]|nr:ATP-binding protein [Streptomyces inusitatus]
MTNVRHRLVRATVAPAGGWAPRSRNLLTRMLAGLADIRNRLPIRSGEPVPPDPVTAEPEVPLVRMPASPTHPERHRRVYLSTIHAPGLARADTTRYLDTWGLAHGTDDLAVLVTELVTNSVTHTETEQVGVSLTRTGPSTVRLVVTDTSRELPPPCPTAAGESEVHGRGLILVDALASRWGAERVVTGKRVWAELDIPPKSRDPHGRSGL